MYFLAMFGWKSGDSRKRKKNSYTSCGEKGAHTQGYSQGPGGNPGYRSQSAPAPAARADLEMWPGGFQGGLVFLWVELGPGGI